MTTNQSTAYSNLLLIGGERRTAVDGRTIDVINPSTGGVVTEIPRCGAADVDLAVEAASAAFPAWATLEPLQRAGYLFRFADAVQERGEELARLDSLDNGSPLHEMRNDVGASTGMMRYFAGLVLEIQGATVPSSHNRLLYSFRQQ